MKNNIAAIRQKQGLSQRELARRLNINHSFISRVEKGEKIPNVLFLMRLSTVLNVKIDELLCTNGACEVNKYEQTE